MTLTSILDSFVCWSGRLTWWAGPAPRPPGFGAPGRYALPRPWLLIGLLPERTGHRNTKQGLQYQQEPKVSVPALEGGSPLPPGLRANYPCSVVFGQKGA